MLQKFLGRFPIGLSSVALLLEACSGGSSGVLPAQRSNAGPSAQAVQFVTQASTAALPSLITTSAGAVSGTDDKFSPTDGDNLSAVPSGGHGQSFTSFDGKRQLPCAPTMSQSGYHIHFYFGVVVNGVHYATADGIGIPGAPTSDPGGLIDSGTCFYNIHTHDASGIVHVETGYQFAYSTVIFYLGDLLRIWGQNISSTSFAEFKGPVTVYYAPYQVVIGRSFYSGTYSKWTADPHTIPLRTHSAIWVEIGTPVTPPKVEFYTAH